MATLEKPQATVHHCVLYNEKKHWLIMVKAVFTCSARSFILPPHEAHCLFLHSPPITSLSSSHAHTWQTEEDSDKQSID